MMTMNTVRLYHASSSYYSMIARFALMSAGLSYDSIVMDIHRRRQQLTPAYAAINPHMTVPSLDTGKQILADSRAIIDWVILERPAFFLDGGEQEQELLKMHYALSIEGLTFGKAMLRFPALRWFFPKLLRRMCTSLRREQPINPGLSDIFSKKIHQNEARIGFFTEGSLEDKVEILQKAASRFILAVPTPVGTYLFGEKPGALDLVLSVFVARLRMIGEGSLVEVRPDLVDWFDRISATSAYQLADIWTVFSIRRVLLGR